MESRWAMIGGCRALAAVCLLMGSGSQGLTQTDGERGYVGEEVCAECHESQYESFVNSAKKAHSYDNMAVMRKGLTDTEFESCLACHTTGYGEPGGFKSLAETPHLKNPGCEVCHGPGSLHVMSGDPADIRGEVSTDDCQKCHTSERVDSFRVQMALHAGAH